MAHEEHTTPAQNRANICIDCKRACGHCCWSACHPVTGKPLFRLVPGWAAELSKVDSAKGGKKHPAWTYHITACPLFVRDEPRESRPMYETEETEKPC